MNLMEKVLSIQLLINYRTGRELLSWGDLALMMAKRKHLNN